MGQITSETPTSLLADADVLIDYRDSDLAILKDVGRRVGRLAVVSQVLSEVHRLTRKHCKDLGIEVIEVETPMLLAAGQIETRVSFNDRLCFLVCQERGWTCVSNDSGLRRLCRRHDVKVRYGLSLVVDLVKLGAMNQRRATTIAHQMHEANPHHINKRVLGRFSRAIGTR